jgi:hypothetical protein
VGKTNPSAIRAASGSSGAPRLYRNDEFGLMTFCWIGMEKFMRLSEPATSTEKGLEAARE